MSLQFAGVSVIEGSGAVDWIDVFDSEILDEKASRTTGRTALGARGRGLEVGWLVGLIAVFKKIV